MHAFIKDEIRDVNCGKGPGVSSHGLIMNSSTTINGIEKESTLNMYVVGVGGQGIILFSKILGQVAIHADRNVLIGEVHGMSQRGGVVSSSIQIGRNVSPQIPEGKADILIGFEPLETLRAIDKANDDSLILFNTNPIIPSTQNVKNGTYPDTQSIIQTVQSFSKHSYGIDAEHLALEAGNERLMNIVMLGALCGTGYLPFTYDDIVHVIRSMVPQRWIDLNMKAFASGYDKLENDYSQPLSQ